MAKKKQKKAPPKKKRREDEVGPAKGPLWAGALSPFCESIFRSSVAFTPLSLQAARVKVQQELARAQNVMKLRDQLQVLCGKGTAMSKYPSLAFERWLLSAKSRELVCQDPILPTTSATQDPDPVLVEDLLHVNFSKEQAERLCRQLEASCQATLASEKPNEGGTTVKMKEQQGSTVLTAARHSLTISSEVLGKLRALHRGEANTFACEVFAMLLRYETLGGPGFQAGLPAPAFLELQRSLGVEMELFASPINCFHGAFCSAFPDVDTAFGSCGSFFEFSPREGSFEVNPPFSVPVMARMLDHLEKLLGREDKEAEEEQPKAKRRQKQQQTKHEKSGENKQRDKEQIGEGEEEEDMQEVGQETQKQKKKRKRLPTHLEIPDSSVVGPLSFAVVVPAWSDNAVWPRLKNSRFLQATLLIPKEEHVWRQSGPMEPVARSVPVPTAIFFLQNALGAVRWPTSPEVLAKVKAALVK